jgi:hypothetical protein
MPRDILNMKNIKTLLFILLVSCTQQTNTGTGQNDTKEATQTLTIEGAYQFDFTISNGQIGNLKTGEQLKEVFEKLKDLTVVRDSVPECEGCDTYTPLYVIQTFDNQNLFEFEPGWDSTDHDKLFRIRTSNEKFTTDKGLSVGMTVKDVKEKYGIDEVDVGGDTGIHIIVKGFNGSFGVEMPTTNDWWKINKENIPDSLRVNEIIIL